MRCDTCIHWRDEQHVEWEAELAGFKRCFAIKPRWDIEAESTQLLQKYPDNSEPVIDPTGFDEVGKRWHDAFKEGMQREKAFVQDGSQYKAELYTAPDFFCARYLQKEEPTCLTTL